LEQEELVPYWVLKVDHGINSVFATAFSPITATGGGGGGGDVLQLVQVIQEDLEEDQEVEVLGIVEHLELVEQEHQVKEI
jgi:hypothetical protein